MLELAGVSKSYGDKHVLTNVSLTVRRGERVGIIGPNGLGKSTLLKIAVERLAADAGACRWGHEVRAGYFPQDHREVLTDGEATPLDDSRGGVPGREPDLRARPARARAVLGRGRRARRSACSRAARRRA